MSSQSRYIVLTIKYSALCNRSRPNDSNANIKTIFQAMSLMNLMDIKYITVTSNLRLDLSQLSPTKPLKAFLRG